MAGLKNTTIAGGYKSIIRINDNTGVSSTPIRCTDGNGSSLPLSIGEEIVKVSPVSSEGNAFEINKAGGGTNIFRANSNTPYVTALGNYVNTQYAYFGVNFNDFSHSSADTHYAIPFSAASGGATANNDVDFGTGLDPATTFTTADTDTQYASQIVPMMWLVPDNITIDDIYAIVGADAATGDAATRIHLFQYTFNSGSTSALTSGSVIAHSTSDTNNAGNEQVYKTTLSKDVTDIDEDKVILAFFRSDSVYSDYSINITVKYHLR